MLSNSRDVELAHALRLAVGRLARRLRQRTLGGLTPSQLSVLASLDRHGPLTLGALAEVEGVAPASISGIVSRLEDKGLVERAANPGDRRSFLVELSAAGEQLLQRGRGERTALLAARLRSLSSAERDTLAAAVALLERLGEDE